MVKLFILPALLLAIFSVHSATITVSTDRNPVSLGEAFKLIFKVQGSQHDEPDFTPLNENLRLLGTSQSSAVSINNGKTSRAITYILTVSPLQQGELVIPAISFGSDTSEPVTVKVQPADDRPQPGDSGQSRQTDNEQLFLIIKPDVAEPYVQQQVILKVKIYSQTRWTKADLTRIKFKGTAAISRQIGKEKTYKAQHQGKKYTVTELRFALFPQASGDLTILPFRLTTRIAAAALRAQPAYTTRTTHSKPVKLTVKPIPASFTGKHWVIARDIQLQEAWSSELAELQAGEPVTRTLAMIGDGVGVGQLPGIELEDRPGIKIYPDQPTNQEQAGQQGLLSTRTQKFALIPSDSGIHELPAIEIPWWNSTTDKMETAVVPAVNLNVADVSATAAAPPQMHNPTGTDKPDTAQTPPAHKAPESWYRPDNASRWLLFSSLALSLLWLITLNAWWQARKAPPKESPHNPPPDAPENPAKARRNLCEACKTNHPEDIHIALLNWARAIWPEHPPRSLEALAQRLAPPLSDEIQSLSRHLYSGHPTDWDSRIIDQQAAQFTAAANSRPQATSASLEPLYR